MKSCNYNKQNEDTCPITEWITILPVKNTFKMGVDNWVFVVQFISLSINPLRGGARGVSRGTRGVMVIIAGFELGYGHGDTSSNPGPDWLHFT